MTSTTLEDLPRIPRGKRLVGDERTEFEGKVTTVYTGGIGIRPICEKTGRSFGAIHHLLKTSGVQMRPKGSRSPGAANRVTPGMP